MRKRSFMLKCFVVFFGVAVLLVSQENRATDHNKFDTIRTKILNTIKEKGVPSISAVVAKDGRIIWEEAFGWADREKRIKATPHTMYSLASISKPITATGLMILVERGLLNLNLPANMYLGRAKLTVYEGRDSEATVKRILHHTSGLPSHMHFFFENESYFPPSMDETILRYGILVTPPGETYQYSNLGYGIISYIISRVSGKSYDKFMKTEVFIPLGMIHTSVGIEPRLKDFVAVRYRPDQSSLSYYDFDHRGASAVFSSAHDLALFGMFQLKNHLPGQKQILADSSIDALHQEIDSKCPDSKYALGWRFSENDKGYHTISHGGGMAGVRTSLKLVPSENIAVAVLCNSKNNIVFEITDEIIALILPKYGSELKRGKETSSETKAEKISLPKELFGEWKGQIKTFKEDVPIKMLVQKDGDVHMKIGDQMETLLNDLRFQEGTLEGRFSGEIKTEDAGRFPHSLVLKIKLRGNRLSGSVMAHIPDRYALSSYVQLWKQ